MKKCFLFLAAALVALLSANAQSLKGDVNNDGWVDVSDVTTVVDLILHPVSVANPVTSIFLSSSSLAVEVRHMTELIATVEPSDATLPELIWTSSNESVVHVFRGYLMPLGLGTATITAMAADGSGVSATCEVTVSLKVVDFNGHDYVDLGLPGGILWATCNVGADEPNDYGDYFAWGDVQGYMGGHTDFSWDTYLYSKDGPWWLTKYMTDSEYGNGDNLTTLEPSDDAAVKLWGGDWRMPTETEWNDLLNEDYCSWTWCDENAPDFNGVTGYKVTSVVPGYEGNSIFLPAAGARFSDILSSETSDGCYWSSSLNLNPAVAYSLYFDSEERELRCYERFVGRSVRPVICNPVFVTAIALSESSMEMPAGNVKMLTATVTPQDATDTSVTWASSDASVATVADGVVTAVAEGTCTITITAADGSGISASCEVTVTAAPDPLASHGYVDLGLPGGVLWATCNIGADEPYAYGDYFAWGDVQGFSGGHTNFAWETCPYSDKYGSSFSKYVVDSFSGTIDDKTTLEPIDDAAAVQWGAGWRMPTDSEWIDLRNDTYTSWIWYGENNLDFNGVPGWKVESKVPGNKGNYIFLPAAGWYSFDGIIDEGALGIYWTSSLDVTYSANAWCFTLYPEHPEGMTDFRYYGYSIRPVVKP